MVINCLKLSNEIKISCLKHGYKHKNENKLFKTWL